MRTGRSWGIISDKADGTEVPLKLSPIGVENPGEMYPALRRICPNKEWRTPVDGVPILRRICPNRDVLILEDDLPNHSSNLAIFDPLHILAYLEKLQFIGFSKLLPSDERDWRRKKKIMKRRTLNPIAMRQASELIISLADEDAETASHVDTFWKVASEGEDKTD
ncbi:hypothetical protein H4Q26_014411 [Puccinia striiformis f. sp. tritici PST-130]|nr:hypothetical protein H4Q26_014411 [Puccinia striiformis f. sp. tritici PST-130]